MKKLPLGIILVWILTFCQDGRSSEKEKDWILEPRDREIVAQILKQFQGDRDLQTGELVLKAGKFFLETPYVGQTLEKGDSEKLVINLRELDCTTFAENCLAIARTLQLKNPDFKDFAEELERIRYRDGIRNEYPSRLHYFSDWIFNNDQKGVVKDISQEIAHTLVPNRVNFMSTHPESYPALKNNPRFVETIKDQENEISNRKAWYIPKDKLGEFEKQLKDGDIIGLATNIEGMDISHVVIAINVEGRIHLLHASSRENKVVISSQPLETYLLNSKLATGIMVARPL
jgi:hypothetical protein